MAARLARIRIFPVKSLDPVEVGSVAIAAGGCLAGDREFALFDSGGRVLNAKRLGSAILAIRSRHSARTGMLCLAAGTERAEFDLAAESDAVGSWLERALGREAVLRRNKESGFPDDELASGPTVVGTASLELLAGHFGLPCEEVRRRFRANLELEGLEPFEEDLLYGPPGRPRRFRIGQVEFLGTNPCRRCVVPTLDSRGSVESGSLSLQSLAEFRRRSARAGSHLAAYPGWHRFAVNTRPAEGQAGLRLRVGDALESTPDRAVPRR